VDLEAKHPGHKFLVGLLGKQVREHLEENVGQGGAKVGSIQICLKEGRKGGERQRDGDRGRRPDRVEVRRGEAYMST